jgi:transposase-like protein
MAAWLEFAHALNVGITAREIFLVRGCYAIPPPAHARNGLTVLAASAPPAPVAPESHSGANPQPTPNSNPTSSETASDEQTPEQEAPGPSDAGPSAGGSHSHTLSQSQSQTDDVTKAIVTSSQVALAAAKRRMHAARFVCPICGTSLTTKRNLEGHVNAHLGVKAHKCTFCEDYFNRTWDRKRHEQRMHPAELASANGTVAPDGSYMPDQDTNADSSGVMDESENDPDREVDELDGDDDDMSASMSTSAHLSGPVPVEHSISLPQWQALASPSVASPGPSNVNSNSIDASASPSGFGKASRAGKAPKSPKSPKGAKSVKPIVTTAPIALASDRRRTREARFICDLCGRALTTRTNLEGHRNAHLGRKEHKCGVCEEGFAREWDRKRHERRAHGVGKDGGKDGIEPAEGMEESVSAAGSPAPDASMVPAPGPEMLGAPSGTDLGLPVSSGSGIGRRMHVLSSTLY